MTTLLDLMERPVAMVPPVMIPEPQSYSRVPQRLQRSRKRGAKLPETAVYVGRPTLFANPFRFERFGHARSVLMYDKWIEGSLSDLELERRGFCAVEIDALHRLRDRVHRQLPVLACKNLVCWCPTSSKWCHANTLLTLANENIPPQILRRSLS